MNFDWSFNLAQLLGPTAPQPLAGALIALITLSAFLALFTISAVTLRKGPAEGSFLVLVVGGLIVDVVSMIVLCVVSVALALIVGAVAQRFSRARRAQLEQENIAEMAPRLEAFVRDSGVDENTGRDILARFRRSGRDR